MITLSEREHLVAEQYCKGLADKEVADSLQRSEWTIKAQKRDIYKKLGISKDTELVLYMFCERMKINFDIKEIRKHGLELFFSILFLVIAALVQMVEIILKKVSPSLYQALGVFLPLITTNCCILGVTILVIQKDYDLLTGVVYAFSTALGFALALIVFAGIREQLSLVNIPKGMRGMSIALVTAGLLAMAFMGFSGVDKVWQYFLVSILSG